MTLVRFESLCPSLCSMLTDMGFVESLKLTRFHGFDFCCALCSCNLCWKTPLGANVGRRTWPKRKGKTREENERKVKQGYENLHIYHSRKFDVHNWNLRVDIVLISADPSRQHAPHWNMDYSLSFLILKTKISISSWCGPARSQVSVICHIGKC